MLLRCSSACCCSSIICFVILLLMPTKLQSHAPATIVDPRAVDGPGCGTACSPTSLRTLTTQEAIAAGMAQAIGTTRPTETQGTDGAGCKTLRPTCGPGQVVTIHVILANGDTDFGNYDSGAITLECDAQGQWVVPPGRQHAGNVVDGYSCVTSQIG